jgi:predicted membrane chloride channel (bestrophin family)
MVLEEIQCNGHQRHLARGFLLHYGCSQYVYHLLSPLNITFLSMLFTVVCLVSNLTEVDLGISNALLTVLGTVLGLVISFRTSSAYERYVPERRRSAVL